jgi:hypothetical protein
MKAAGMTIAHIVRLLTVANKDLPSVEYRCQELKREEGSLRAGNSNAARIFRELSDSISDEYKTLNQYRIIRNQEKQDTDKTCLTKLRLEELIECIQNNKEEYLKIKETIKREVSYILKDPRQLLRIALISLIISSRKDPNIFHALYYNMNIPPRALVEQALSVSSDNIQLDHDDDEANYEKVLLTESEILYNKIIDIVINKTIKGRVNLRGTVSQGKLELSNDQKGIPRNLSTYTYRKE